MSTSSLPSFIKILPNVKVYGRRTPTDDGRCALTIAHSSLRLRWAKKIGITFYQFGCYLFQFTEHCMSTPNYIQFDIYFVKRVNFIHILWKSLNHGLSAGSVAQWSKAIALKAKGLCVVRFPVKTYIFILIFLACFPFLTARRAHANKIIYDHSHLHVVYVVLDPRYD